MNATTLLNEVISELTESDIRTACRVLTVLEGIAWKKFDFEKASAYCQKVQTIETDIRHIKELTF